MSDKIKLGISIGDINGIGIEVIMKTFGDKRMMELCTPIVFGSSKIASYQRNLLDEKSFSFHIIDNIEDARPNKANMLNCWPEEIPFDVGNETTDGGKYARESLKKATQFLKEGKVDALITAPIHKNNIQSEDFNFPGHTEYLQHHFGKEGALMILMNEELRVALVTGHIPVSEIASKINADIILAKLETLNNSLQMDFDIPKPKIAVLGLNPHAGDGGVIGNEEQEIITPAIEKANEKGILAMGPFPADGFFGSHKYKNYDAVLAMYHDQGLVPFKTLSFGMGVNFTAGLEIVRTSPDHGTGFDIAGQGIANEQSFRQAVYRAIDIYRIRQRNIDLKANALKKRAKGSK